MADEQKRSGPGIGGIGDGIRTGIGILNAFREAVEDTLQEAVDRGDLSPDRARRAMRDAAQKLQEGLGDARERLDLVSRKEYEDLRAELASLRERVSRLEGPGGAGAAGEGASPDAPGIIVTE